MQPTGFRTGLRQKAPCRSALNVNPGLPLRPLLFRSCQLSFVRGSLADGAGSPQPDQLPAAREPSAQNKSAGASAEGPPAAASPVNADGAVTVDADAYAEEAAAAVGHNPDASTQVAAGAAVAASQRQGQTSGAVNPTSASTSAFTAAASSAAATAGADGGSAAGGFVSSMPQFLQQLLAWLASVWSAVQQFPMWVQMQHLRRLREECEEDPKDADKHAAYLSELVRSNPREVLARVESRQFGVNAAVAAEYLRALVATGKVTELVKADGAAAAAEAETAAAASAVAEVAPPRTLGELLGDLQEQLAAAAVSDGSASASFGGSPSLDMPGSSLRRPLHVVVSGLPPLLQSAPGAGGSVLKSSAASRTPLLLRPLALLWRLASGVLLGLVLALAYLVGSQAIRRVQASGGFNPAAFGAGPPVSAAGGGGGSAANNGSGASAASSSSTGSPSVEPKEYRKEELPEKSIRTFKDVKGCDEAKEELREVVEFLRNPGKFTRLGAKLPKGVLLSGPPGTGKTLLAKAVAGEAGVPFFYRAGSEFEELYVGVGSRRMRALFAAAKKRSPCIVFIDEIDAIGGNRKSWENHTRKTLNQLLVEMDGFESSEGIIVMAATNMPDSLDPALKRPGRFDRQVAVSLPDIKGRRDILDYYLSDKPLGPDVDRELLARQTQGFSGADISNLINESAILAAKEGSEVITQRMLDWAYDKILMGVERKSVKRTLEARRRTAFHEAGHALVALATPGASPIHKATIVPRGHALGMVTQVGREDEFSINRQQMLALIHVCMGGTVAEELVFGPNKVSSGATDDLRQATSMARHMVSECGMSATIGPVYVAAHHERHGGSGVSEATRERVDGEVAALLSEAKEAVRVLLAERMQDLRTLAEALLDKETLTREEINSLLQHGGAGQQTPPPQAPGSSGGDSRGGGGGDERKHRDGDDLEGDPAPAAAQASAAATPSSEASPASASASSAGVGGTTVAQDSAASLSGASPAGPQRQHESGAGEARRGEWAAAEAGPSELRSVGGPTPSSSSSAAAAWALSGSPAAYGPGAAEAETVAGNLRARGEVRVGGLAVGGLAEAASGRQGGTVGGQQRPAEGRVASSSGDRAGNSCCRSSGYGGAEVDPEAEADEGAGADAEAAGVFVADRQKLFLLCKAGARQGSAGEAGGVHGEDGGVQASD